MIRRILATTALAGALALRRAACAQDSPDPIRLTLHDWTGQLITTQIMGEVLKKAGLNVEYVQADYLAQFAGLKTGDLHVAMEIWETTGREAMDEATATGQVVNLGETGMQAIEEWWYPAYMKEACPGLPDWKALLEPACAEAFATPETLPDGRYLGGPVTWGGFDEERIEALELPFQVIHAGTDAALFAELEVGLPAPGADPALDLRAALGADQVRGRVGRVPALRARLLHRPGLGREPGRDPRLRQAARPDLEGRLGRPRGQVAAAPRPRSRTSTSTTRRWATMIAAVDLDGQEASRTWSTSWMARQRGPLEGLDRPVADAEVAGDGMRPSRRSPAAASGSSSAPGAEAFLARRPRARRREELAAAGLIPAVIDASLAVQPGRDLRHHGAVRLGQVDAGPLPLAAGRADAPARSASTAATSAASPTAS